MVEMKSGYKMTEVGVIPEDWEVKELGDITKDMSDGPFGSNLKSCHYTNNKEVRIIQLSNIGTDGWSDNNRKYTTYKHLDTIRRCEVKSGNLVIAKMMPAGRAIICPSTDAAYVLSSDAVRVNLLECVNNDYAFYCTKSGYYLSQIAENTQGSTRARTSIKKLRNILFCMPDVKEQVAIAAALSDVDSLISALTKKIEKKKAIKQGLMQQFLTGKKRLPGYEKNRESVQTEWGAIPKDWKTLSIGKCCSIKARIGWQGLKKTEYQSSGEYVLVTGTDFLNGRIDWKSCVYVSKKRYEQDNNIQIVKHDILITKDGTIGKVAFLDDVPCLGTLNSGIFVVRSHSLELDQCYLSKIFESFIFDAFLESLVAGSTINHLYQKDFVHFNFPVPPTMSEQTAIANILSDCDSEIAALEEKRDKYKEIKQGMMQQLLTGKIRLI